MTIRAFQKLWSLLEPSGARFPENVRSNTRGHFHALAMRLASHALSFGEFPPFNMQRDRPFLDLNALFDTPGSLLDKSVAVTRV